MNNANTVLTQLEHVLSEARLAGLPKSWFDDISSSEKLQFYLLAEDGSFHEAVFKAQVKLTFISTQVISNQELSLLSRAVCSGLGCKAGSVQLIVGTPDQLLLQQLLAGFQSIVLLGLHTSFLDSTAHTLVKLQDARILKTYRLADVIVSTDIKRKFWQDLQLLMCKHE